MKESVISIGPRGMPDLVHNGSPSLQSDHNEDIEDALEDVVEGGLPEVWVSPVNALACLARGIFAAKDVVLEIII
jgi:hypothetical protein